MKLKKKLFTVVCLFSLGCSIAVASKTSPRSSMLSENSESNALTKRLTAKFMQNEMSEDQVEMLQEEVLQKSGKAIPALVQVMKNSKYPDKNRWVATFLVGQVMGAKSAPFIAKFLNHPSWVMRMASLKTLLALKQHKYGSEYAKALQDDSLIVRSQALENIRKLKLKSQAPYVWQMLYDKKNYYKEKGEEKVSHKRTHLIKDVILTIGDLEFDKAQDPLLKMIQNERYSDIFEEMDYALSKIIDKESPDGSINIKKHFWKRTAMAYTEF